MNKLVAAITLALITAAGPGQAQQAEFGGGGQGSIQADDYISRTQRLRIERMLQDNVAQLGAAGRLQASGLHLPLATALAWPLRPAVGFEGDPGVHGISNFIDHDPAYPDQLLDWNCGARTYDLASGYNHPGTDIFLWPFYWLKMDQGAVDIVAAAPGQIIGKTDGNPDRSCSFDGAGDWNAVYVQHADGSVAWYGHMRKDSLTSKAVGDTVNAGEFLGKVGSSGMSTGPHLHFEIQESTSGPARDPWHGSCNALPSMWAAQRPYYDSAINKVATQSAPPQFSQQCPDPEPETPNLRNYFKPGDDVYAVFYYRDQLADQLSQFQFFRPDATPSTAWEHRMSDSTSAPYYSSTYWYWKIVWPTNTFLGKWTLKATYEGKTYSHRFYIGDWMFVDDFE